MLALNIIPIINTNDAVSPPPAETTAPGDAGPQHHPHHQHQRCSISTSSRDHRSRRCWPSTSSPSSTPTMQYLHLQPRPPLQEMLALNIIPIINTNDAVSPPPAETTAPGVLNITDNDSLASRVAVDVGADLAILMSVR